MKQLCKFENAGNWVAADYPGGELPAAIMWDVIGYKLLSLGRNTDSWDTSLS